MPTDRANRPPRVLYLSFYFPPSRASGVYRARATANHLAARGWDVTAYAAPLDFLYGVISSTDESLLATVDPRITVERPPLHQFVWRKDRAQHGLLRRALPRLTQRAYGWSQAHLFPEHYSSWGLASVGRALRQHARRRFDVVLATGNPFAAFGAAWLFHRLTGVPYVLDYRDSWTLNLFTNGPAFPDGHPAWQWERRAIGASSGVVFVNEALRDWHAQRYPGAADRMLVVPNGWDPDLTADLEAGAAADPPAVDRPAGGDRPAPLRFGYLGTLTTAQPLEELVAAFRLARGHADLADAELRLHGHLGFFKTSQAELTSRLGLDPAAPGVTNSGVRYCGPVSKTEVAGVYRDSDVLVFLAGGSRYVTSGKIFEYMASGRPIVSVHAPGIAAEEVLTGYPLWFTARSLDPADVAQSMIAAGKVARDTSDEQRAAAARHAAGYARELVLRPLEARLRAVAGQPGAHPEGIREE